jgi:hypothetical protein
MPRKGKNITAKAVQATEDLPPKVGTIDAHPEPDEDPHGDDGLTDRQREFVKAYVGPAAGNATKAAAMAGYNDSNNDSLRVTAHRLLTKANVQRALARSRAEKHGGPEWTRAGIVEIADANFADFMVCDASGEPTFDLKAAYAAGAMGLVKEITEEVISGGGGPVQVIKRRVKLHDRQKALDTLAKMHGMLVDKVEDVTPPKPSPTAKLLTNPAAFRAARQLAAAMSEDAESSTNGHDPARN